MFRSALFASLIALGAAGAAQAQAQAPLDGSAAALGGNVVGGGVATLSGGGDNATVTYSTGGAGGGGGGVLSQSGRIARFASGQGEGGPRVEYLTPAPAADPGREAWMLGGGDNAEVVYGRRR